MGRASVGGPVSYFVYHFDGVAWTGVPLLAIADFNAPVASSTRRDPGLIRAAT